MKLSIFGNRFTRDSGIVALMDDLGSAAIENPDMIMMGGGNPGRLPEAEAIFQRRLEHVMADPQLRHELFGLYQAPQGNRDFCEQVAALLKQQFGWPLGAKNIAVSNGSQSAFFILFNMFAGKMPDGSSRSIHLPLTPGIPGLCRQWFERKFFFSDPSGNRNTR